MEIIIKLIKFFGNIINDGGVNMHISKFAVIIRCDVGCNFDFMGLEKYFLGVFVY